MAARNGKIKNGRSTFTLKYHPMAARNGKVKNGRSTFTLKYHPMAARKWESKEWKFNIYIQIPSYGSQKMGKSRSEDQHLH